MIAITPIDVTNFASELMGKVSDAEWLDIVNYANQFDLSDYDTDVDRRMVRILLSAHIAKSIQLGRGGATGPVTSESAGGVRRSYGFVAYTTGNGLSSTRYGQLLDTILMMSGCNGPMLV